MRGNSDFPNRTDEIDSEEISAKKDKICFIGHVSITVKTHIPADSFKATQTRKIKLFFSGTRQL